MNPFEADFAQAQAVRQKLRASFTLHQSVKIIGGIPADIGKSATVAEDPADSPYSQLLQVDVEGKTRFYPPEHLKANEHAPAANPDCQLFARKASHRGRTKTAALRVSEGGSIRAVIQPAASGEGCFDNRRLSTEGIVDSGSGGCEYTDYPEPGQVKFRHLNTDRQGWAVARNQNGMIRVSFGTPDGTHQADIPEKFVTWIEVADSSLCFQVGDRVRVGGKHGNCSKRAGLEGVVTRIAGMGTGYAVRFDGEQRDSLMAPSELDEALEPHSQVGDWVTMVRDAEGEVFDLDLQRRGQVIRIYKQQAEVRFRGETQSNGLTPLSCFVKCLLQAPLPFPVKPLQANYLDTPDIPSTGAIVVVTAPEHPLYGESFAVDCSSIYAVFRADGMGFAYEELGYRVAESPDPNCEKLIDLHDQLATLEMRRDRLLKEGPLSEPGAWIEVYKVSKRNFREATWRATAPIFTPARSGGNVEAKVRKHYIGKANSPAHQQAQAMRKRRKQYDLLSKQIQLIEKQLEEAD